MGEFADLRIGRGAAVDLSDNGLRGRAAHVKEPGFDGDFRRGLGQIAEAYKICVGWRVGPGRVFQFGRHTGGLRRVEAGTGEFQDATELKVLANDLSKERRVRFGGVRARREIGDGNARLIYITEAGACSEPPLGLRERRVRG